MEIREFANVIADKCFEVLGNNYTVSSDVMVKNNGLMLTVIRIRENNNNVSPTIHMEEFFDKYVKNEMSLEEVVSNVIDIYNKHRVSDIDTNRFLKYENVKSMIKLQLINTEMNKEKLSNIPHIEFLDLSYIFRVVISEDEIGVVSFIIENSHADLWEKSASELFDVAIKNSYNDTVTVRSICDILAEKCLLPLFDGCSMYVISNKEGIDGAHYIFTSSDIQKQIYDIFEESFYILPSSINDTICIPQSEVHDVEMLRQIIKEVNTNEVREEEILSDSLYFYNAETEKIEITKCSMVA